MKTAFSALAAFTFLLALNPSGATPALSSADVVVNVANSTIVKLSAADGTVLWSVNVGNDGALAVDPVDLGVYTGAGGHTVGGNGTVYKFATDGTLAWTNSITASGGCNSYNVSYAAVDSTSSKPGVVWIESGCSGGMAKSDRSTGAQQWSVLANGIGRASVDPASGQMYAMTSSGTNYSYHTLDSAKGWDTLNSASSCEGYTELNPADGMLYRGGANCGITLWQTNTSALDATNWSMDLSAYVASFDALAVQPWEGGYIYVASVSSSKIVVVDPATRTVVTSFDTAIAPRHIAVDPTGGKLYVADGASHFVYAYSPTGSLIWISPELGGTAYSIAAPRGIVGKPESTLGGSLAAPTSGECTQTFDGVIPPALPTGWIATNAFGPDPLWVTSNSGSLLPVADSAPNSAFVDDPNELSDKLLDSPQIVVPSGAASQVSFRHRVELEEGFDGGVLEISINGAEFQDILAAGGSFVTGGYNGTIGTDFNSPIGGREAWTGSIGSAGFETVVANLPPSAAGQIIVVRWRMASDTSVSSQGWRIDTTAIACPSCPAPTARVSVSRASIHKGEDAVFTITARDNCSDITIIYDMRGRARLGVDYTLSGTVGQVFIPAGQTSTTVTLHALYNSRTKQAPAKMRLQRSTRYFLGNRQATVVLLAN